MAAARISVTAEIVGTGSDGTEPSLLFSVQRHGVYSSDVTLLKRYLFNCGEGTQRLCGENGVKLSSLDSMFFTRFDVNSVSGVPGMIFALSSCGSASLKLHGPMGLRGFLLAIQSFVRRKYPQITCIEISDTTGTSDTSGTSELRDGSNLNCEAWSSSADQSDQHMRIFPVVLHSTAARSEMDQHPSSCILCQHGDVVPHNSPTDVATAARQQLSHRTGRETASAESDEHTEFRAWLLAFYSSKVPDKMPYVDVILNRYRGRYDDLKTQLCAKYGELDVADKSEAVASDSSSSDDEDSDEDEPDFAVLPLNRDWLLRFYRRYQPEKLLLVDRVLKQFSGREDTLKQILLQKYWTPNVIANGVIGGSRVQHDGDNAPQSKRQKLESEAKPQAAAVTTSDDSGSRQEKVFVTPQQPSEAAEPASNLSSSLCYVMKFLHGLHAVVWIIDCRSVDHINDLTTRFQAPSTSGCDDHQPVLLVHFSPPSVFLDLKYQTWAASLGRTVQQLVFDGMSLRSVENGVFSWVFRASAKHTLEQRPVFGSADATAMWSHLDCFLSSQGQEKDVSSADNTSERHQKQILWKLENGHEVHVAQSKQRLHLLRKSEGATQVTSDYERTGWRRQEEDKSAEDNGSDDDKEEKVSEDKPEQLAPEGDPLCAPSMNKETAMKLVILGTGSAAPSKLRGSTGIYLELKPSNSIPISSRDFDTKVPDSMLIDCGEGTYGQLSRQFGNETAARIGGLRCIWISHSHADHQCGLVRVLYEFVRYQVALHKSNRRGLLVLAPQSVLSYVISWMPHILDSCGVQDASQRASVVGFATCREFNQPQHRFRTELFAQIGSVVSEITSVPVWHCYDSYGLVLQLRNGQKIVYSGDTRPCRQLVAAGMHASLLIHEATFDDSMADDAVKKKHSTVGEALEVARQMRAKEVVLTHFSQRYPKLPPPVTAAPGGGGGSQSSQPLQPQSLVVARVHCAFDGYVHYIPA